MNGALSQFKDAIRAAGLEPPEIIEPGKWHRFPGIGKKASNDAGWCRLFEDGLGGCFGDWSLDFTENWQAKRSKLYSQTERSAFAQKVEAAKRQDEAARATRQANAAQRAATIWQAATPAPANHPYLTRKRIRPHGARLHQDALTLPVTAFAGQLTNLQFIAPDGRKWLLSGGRKQGCRIHVAGNKLSRIIICEGWATGCTLAEDEPEALVLAAIDAGNLRPVALQARARWSAAQIIIAGDDDRRTPGNPGATKAKDAAIASGALLALPPWPAHAPAQLTDFNDLALWLAGGGV